MARASALPATIERAIPAAYSVASCHSNREEGMMGVESTNPTIASIPKTEIIPVAGWRERTHQHRKCRGDVLWTTLTAPVEVIQCLNSAGQITSCQVENSGTRGWA
jgi:hypothetical protein